MKRKYTTRLAIIPGQLIKWAFLIALLLFTVYPVVYALLGSLKTNFELTLGGKLWPEKLMFSNYADAFINGNFGRYTYNSVLVSGIVTILAVVTSSLAGYVFARREFTGKKLIMNLYLAFMFISLGSVTIYPLYTLFSRVGLTQSVLGMALVMTGGQAANVFLINGFIRSVPRELDEAAYIDGCTPFQVYRIMIVPMIRPILAVVLLFSFRTSWNDYLTPLIMTIGKTNLRTLTVAVVQLKYSANAAAEWHIMLAGASIALIPVLIIYGFTHKQFISGLTAGAVKG